jgi:hypothetical protein
LFHQGRHVDRVVQRLSTGAVHAVPVKVAAVLRQARHLHPIIDPLILAHSAFVAQILKYGDQLKALAQTNATYAG